MLRNEIREEFWRISCAIRQFTSGWFQSDLSQIGRASSGKPRCDEKSTISHSTTDQYLKFTKNALEISTSLQATRRFCSLLVPFCAGGDLFIPVRLIRAQQNRLVHEEALLSCLHVHSLRTRKRCSAVCTCTACAQLVCTASVAVGGTEMAAAEIDLEGMEEEEYQPKLCCGSETCPPGYEEGSPCRKRWNWGVAMGFGPVWIMYVVWIINDTFLASMVAVRDKMASYPPLWHSPLWHSPLWHSPL
jgi:hypothetical protein